MNALVRVIFMLAVLATSACNSPEAICSTLNDALERCGFPTTDLECDNISEADLESLAQRFGERDCAAFATDAAAVDPRLCAIADWSCPGNPLPPPSEAVPQFPLVLVSGIDGSPLFDWHPRIATTLTTEGIAVHHIEVLPWATTPERAADLWESLRSLASHPGDEKLNLVCYAVGGLDCRYLVSPGGLFKDDPTSLAQAQGMVASITTVSTPHRGTRVAEAAESALQDGTISDVLQALVGSGINVSIPSDAAVLRTLDGLSLDSLEQFNTTVIDAPNIPYFSWAGISHIAGESSAASEQAIRESCVDPNGNLLYFRHPNTNDILNPFLWATVGFSYDARVDGRDVQSPSDGMVSVESAKWGTFMGCLPADHYDVVGQIGHSTRDPVTGLDAPELYTWVASVLGDHGL